ncbi:hypothetical protein TWF694_006334 [Orbilia ellipsospora]|uniref:F-box domain-containing protein n=1 Tax=Orbilia ellipsospora TaxID=2528407 RepID=A0AAV9XJV9_9PEZI
MESSERSPLTDLPDEILLNIAIHLTITKPVERQSYLNSLSQTCRRLRNIIYPLVNRHILFDEGNQYPDLLLNLVVYSLTEPLVEYTRAATFRLLSENVFYLEDDYEEEIEESMPIIKSLLEERAGSGDGNEVFGFIAEQMEEYGLATLATILFYQLRNIRELELACSITALSSRFLLTTMHHFDPPFKLDRLGMARLVNFESANYHLLERFLRLGVPELGIDYRFGSTGGHSKLHPPPITVEYDSISDESEASDPPDDTSERSIEEDWKDFNDYSEVATGVLGNSAILDMYYPGYEPLDCNIVGYEHPIDYNLPGTDEVPPDDENGWLVEDLRMWVDERPSPADSLVLLLKKIKGLRTLDIKLFPIPAFVSRDECWLLDIICSNNIKETLESLTFRCWSLNEKLQLPSFCDYTVLRRVHLYFNSEMVRRFDTLKEEGKCYITNTFPPQLEYLRLDFLSSNRASDFAAESIKISISDMPVLRMCFGYAIKRISAIVRLKLERIFLEAENRSITERAREYLSSFGVRACADKIILLCSNSVRASGHIKPSTWSQCSLRVGGRMVRSVSGTQIP